MEGYAQAYFGEGPLRVDALTVNPFLGLATLEPTVRAARDAGAGLFVLARTSNPGGPQFQEAVTTGGRRLFENVYAAVCGWNAHPGFAHSSEWSWARP